MESVQAAASLKGGAFLIENISPEEMFTYEDLGEEHLAIGRTADDFWTNEIEPEIEAIRSQKQGTAVRLLRKSAELGLTAISALLFGNDKND